MKSKILKFKNKIQLYTRVGLGALVASNTFATNVIPLSSEQQIKNGTGIDSTILNLLQKNIVPIFEVALILGILWKIGSGLWKAYKEYMHDRDFAALKEAIFAGVFVGIVGGIVCYLLDILRNADFTG